jgi:hypothetical protein
MSKRDILFLTLPSIVLIVIGATALALAGDLLKGRQDDERVVQKLRTGGVDLKPENVMEMLINSRSRELELAGNCATFLRLIGGCAFAGAVLQVYVLFRVRAGCKKVDA